VIPAREVLDLRNEWQLRGDVIEKDYTLGWMLAAIAANDELAETWVFKGGTCLRKCYFETYRFSEDLDFTVINGGPKEPEDLVPIFGDIASWLYDQSGIQLEVDHRSFRRHQNRRAHATTVGRIGFRGATATPRRDRVANDRDHPDVTVRRGGRAGIGEHARTPTAAPPALRRLLGPA